MPLAVDHFTLSEFQSNCYVVRADRTAAEAAVIDPGGDPTALRLELARMGTRTCAASSSRTPISTTSRASPISRRERAPRSGRRRGEIEALRDGVTRTGRPVRAYDPEHSVSGGDEFAVAGLSWEVVDVPGHSAGHIAFVADGTIFSGDLLFAGSVGRVDLPGGDWDTLLESVRRLVDRYGRRRVVHSGPRPGDDARPRARHEPVSRELRVSP